MLLSKITDFQEILPIIENLRKPSIKPRHWQEVMVIAKTNFPYESENFILANIMDSPILKFKDDIEEVRGQWGLTEGDWRAELVISTKGWPICSDVADF